MRISHTAITNSLGPGKRFVIWVQGCNKRCNGCINPAGWELDAGEEKTVEELTEAILSVPELVGITISGGEPLLQINEVSELIYRIKNCTDLDVMLYSGYSYEQALKLYGDMADKLFRQVDIFIDGEYIENQNDNSLYRGSANQKIYYFTEKYRKYAVQIAESKERSFSFEILDNGDVYFIGIPPVGFYEKFIENMGG